VRADRAARPAERQELRRIMDRIRLAGWRADRGRRQQMSTDGCGAPAGGIKVTAGAGNQAVVQGHGTSAGTPVPSGYARLLNSEGEVVPGGPPGRDGRVRLHA